MSQIIGEQIGIVRVGANTPIPSKIPTDFNDFTMPSAWVDNLRFDANGVRWTDANDQSLHEGDYFPSWYQGTQLSVQANWLKKVESVIWCEPDYATTAQQELAPYVGVFTGSFPYPDASSSNYAFFNDSAFPIFRVSGANNNKVVAISTSPYNTYTFAYWCDADPLVSGYHFNIDSYNLEYTSSQNVSTLAPISNNFLKQEYAVFVFGTEVEVVVTTNLGDNDYYHNKDKISFYHNIIGVNPVQKPFMSIPQVQSNPSLSYGPQTGIGSVLTLTAPQQIPNRYSDGIPWDFQGWYFSTSDAWTTTNPLPSSYFSVNQTCNVNLIFSKIIMTAVYAPSSDYYTITYHSGLPEQV